VEGKNLAAFANDMLSDLDDEDPPDIEDVIKAISSLDHSIYSADDNITSELREMERSLKFELNFVQRQLNELHKSVFSIFALLLMIMVLLIFGWVFSSPGELAQALKTFFYYLFNPGELVQALNTFLAFMFVDFPGK